ncbi:MAG: SlyX family protein [Gammaproteobacteria bacterium]|nr:SlyX family protein [Gammaproteobacteria bacterium]
MEKKVTELEIRYTQQEDSLQQISDIVATQQDEIAHLKRELQELRGQLLRVLPDEDGTANDDAPPHY